MIDRKPLPNGWNVSGEYQESKQADYVKKVTEELLASPRQKRDVPTTFKGKLVAELTREEREEFIFSMQPASTQAAITAQKTRHHSEDIEHLLRPMPNCVANPDAKTQDELTGMRPLKPDEIMAHSNTRRERGKIGQSDAGSVNAEKRDKGIHAFTYSQPAELTPEQRKKVTKLEEIVNTPLNPEKVNDSLTYRAACWLKDKTGVWWW